MVNTIHSVTHSRSYKVGHGYAELTTNFDYKIDKNALDKATFDLSNCTVAVCIPANCYDHDDKKRQAIINKLKKTDGSKLFVTDYAINYTKDLI